MTAEYIVVTGRPGNGKTLYVVSRLLQPEIKDHYYIMHNIDGFQDRAAGDMKLIDPEFCCYWPTYIKDLGIEAESFFSKDYQSELAEKIRNEKGRSICIVIDEMHDFFCKFNQDQLSWLSWYRHLDQKVYGLTQSLKQIHYQYRNSMKVEKLAKMRLPLLGVVYQDKYEGVTMGWELFRAKAVHLLSYKTADSIGKKKINYYIVFLMLFILGVGLYAIKANPFEAKAADIKKKQELVSPGEAEKVDEKTNKNKTIKPTEKTYSFLGILGRRIMITDQEGVIYNAADVFPHGQFSISGDSLVVMEGKKQTRIDRIFRGIKEKKEIKE